ncbi:hypothetical protein C7U61_18170 [Rhizobium sp. JAB6]|nr:hypothetical protein C7U61_18170 [Rhizobium sp. JAB6]
MPLCSCAIPLFCCGGGTPKGRVARSLSPFLLENFLQDAPEHDAEKCTRFSDDIMLCFFASRAPRSTWRHPCRRRCIAWQGPCVRRGASSRTAAC